jgi:hypothetical protein
LERAGAPTFQTVVEIITKDKIRIIRNVAKVVDLMFARKPYSYEERWLDRSDNRYHSVLKVSSHEVSSLASPRILSAELLSMEEN